MGAWSTAALAGVMALALTTGCLARRDSTGGGTAGDGAGREAGAGGGAGGSDAGGAGQTSRACGCVATVTSTSESCEFAWVECGYDPYCLDWLGCFEDCADDDWTAACLEGCDANHPGAVAMGYAVVHCVCASCAGDLTCAAGCP